MARVENEVLSQRCS